MSDFKQAVEEIFQKHEGICTKCYGGANCPYNDVLDKCPLYQDILAAHNAELESKLKEGGK
jgi:ribosomal protein L40E